MFVNSDSFRRVELEQGTLEWLAWRKQGITATDASIIMGRNQYTSIEELWQKKISDDLLISEQNEAMFNGSRNEDKARKLYINTYQEHIEPACIESVALPYMRASLDGINSDGSRIVEIKCPSHFGTAKRNKTRVTDEYYAQIQHQLYISGAETCVFFSYFRGDDSSIIVYPDHTYIKELLDRCDYFYQHLEAKIEPDFSFFS